MNRNVYLYILVMAGVTYLIRLLPLTLIKKEIKNVYIKSCSRYRWQGAAQCWYWNS